VILVILTPININYNLNIKFDYILKI